MKKRTKNEKQNRWNEEEDAFEHRHTFHIIQVI
jgi:hypothetical protein